MEPQGTLMVGVQADEGLASLAQSYRLTASIGSQPAITRIVEGAGVAAGKPVFELPLRGSPSRGELLSVLVEGFRQTHQELAALPDARPIVTRKATAPFVLGPPQLVPLRLEMGCTEGAIPNTRVPACAGAQTCSEQRCVDGTLHAEDLQPFAPSWSDEPDDPCRTAFDGPPALTVGTGQTDYAPVADDATVELERGPQGGHHLWIAVRTRQLRQARAMITLRAEQPGSDLAVPNTAFVFSLSQDEGSACKVYGLRYQLDNGQAPVSAFLDKPLRVTVEVTDRRGARASASKTVHIANTIRG
jgi:hypothetical protein